MRRLEVTNPEPAQGSQRPALRGPGAEVLRLIGYPVVRKVLADLGRRSRRPSEIDLGWRVDVSTFHRHAAGVTQALLDGPLGLPEIEMSVHLARPGVTGHPIRRLLRNGRRAGFLLSEAPRGQERYRLADRGR